MRQVLLTILIIILTKTTCLSQVQQKQKFIPVSLTVDQWNVILTGLGKLPLDQSQETYMSIVSQVNREIAKENTPPKPIEKPKTDSTEKKKP